jgi:transposase
MGGPSNVSSDQATTPLEEPLSMMNQETYVKIKQLREQGWTIAEIAAETGFHPETISIRLKAGEPPTTPAGAR